MRALLCLLLPALRNWQRTDRAHLVEPNLVSDKIHGVRLSAIWTCHLDRQNLDPNRRQAHHVEQAGQQQQLLAPLAPRSRTGEVCLSFSHCWADSILTTNHMDG